MEEQDNSTSDLFDDEEEYPSPLGGGKQESLDGFIHQSPASPTAIPATDQVIEPHRTYTNHTITELARCVGCFCTSSGLFKHSEPHRTYTKHTSTELARYRMELKKHCQHFLIEFHFLLPN